jgi:hypothetical protein
MVKVDQPKELADYLRAQQVIVLPRGPMRLVTHLDVDAAGIDRAVAAFAQFRQRSAQRAH